LGADVIMQFDHVIPGKSNEAEAREASDRSLRWLERCAAEFDRISSDDPPLTPQALFPVLQGGVHEPLRREAATSTRSMREWLGYGIGGLSVGEEKEA